MEKQNKNPEELTSEADNQQENRRIVNRKSVAENIICGAFCDPFFSF